MKEGEVTGKARGRTFHHPISRIQPPLQEDGDLLDRFHLGDPSAFDELVERYHLPVYHLAYRMTQNRADAEDIAQEVFVRAYRSLKTFRRASSLKTWLFQIAINLSIDHQRRGGLEALPKRAGMNPAPPSAQDPEALALLEQKEREMELQEAVAKLPEKQRAALILRIFHDLSFKEIAEVVGSPLGTVKANYHHAVMRLRCLLQDRSSH